MPTIDVQIPLISPQTGPDGIATITGEYVVPKVVMKLVTKGSSRRACTRVIESEVVPSERTGGGGARCGVGTLPMVCFAPVAI